MAKYGPYKMVLAGEGATGKTSLLARVKFDKFSESYSLTIGGNVIFLELDIEDEKARLMCWDSAGQNQFACIRQAFYRGLKGFIIVFDVSWRGSFDAIQSWYHELKQTAPSAPFILVGNKADLAAHRQVSHEEGQALAAELNADYYFETSAKTGIQARKPFEYLTEQIINHKY